MPNPKKETPPQTDNKLSETLATKSEPVQAPTPAAEFGSDAWYAARWENQLKALKGEIWRQQYAIIEVASAKFEELAPIWKAHSQRPLREHYTVLKHLELYEIAKSLYFFCTASFRFFHDGFYQLANPAAGRAEQASLSKALAPPTSQEGEIVAKVNSLEKRIEREVSNVVDAALNQLSTDSDQLVSRLVGKLESCRDAFFYASKKYSPNFVLSSLMEQSSQDLKLLQQIYCQRAIHEELIGAMIVDTFLMVEELGRRALAI